MRAANDSKRNQRIALRTTRAVKRAIERAAALNGQSLTDFVVTKAYESALETLDRHERMVLRSEDRDAFVEALIHPPAPSTRLKAAARRSQRRAAGQSTSRPD